MAKKNKTPWPLTTWISPTVAFAGCFTVANLYYSHPILNLLADDFHVTDEQASYIPTLAQAGYAGGLLFLCPLGDLVKRRPFVLWLVWLTATLWYVFVGTQYTHTHTHCARWCISLPPPPLPWQPGQRQVHVPGVDVVMGDFSRIGLCVTDSFAAFGTISFLTSVTTVTPQLMLPLVGDMAPPPRRSTSLSIVVSGMLLGMLTARLLSGVVANSVGWRYIYWIAFGLQYCILVLLYFFMPDYPSTNPGVVVWRKYPSLLLDIVRLVFQYPVLVQACLVGLFTATTFTSFWTTLTFLLAGSPYHYSSLVIGLFALIGIASMVWGPVFARTVMEKHQPWFSVIIGEVICLVGAVVGTYTGKSTVAGPVIQAVGIDIGLQTSQIANRTAIYGVAPKARNRVNTAYMVSVFVGQLLGTAVGNSLYADGGWIASGSASVGFVSAALVVCLLRGPHEQGWIGWRGGYNMRKGVPKKPKDEKSDEEDGRRGPKQQEPRVELVAGEEGQHEEPSPTKETRVDVRDERNVPDHSSRSSQRTLSEEIQPHKEKE